MRREIVVQRGSWMMPRVVAVRTFGRLGTSLLAVLPRALWPRLVLLLVAATGPLIALLIVSAVTQGLRMRSSELNQAVIH